MTNKRETRFEDVTIAFAALAYLLAEAVPGAKFTEEHTDNENSRVFRLVLPNDTKLSDQSKISLEKLIGTASGTTQIAHDAETEYVFFLEV